MILKAQKNFYKNPIKILYKGILVSQIYSFLMIIETLCSFYYKKKPIKTH